MQGRHGSGEIVQDRQRHHCHRKWDSVCRCVSACVVPLFIFFLLQFLFLIKGGTIMVRVRV